MSRGEEAEGWRRARRVTAQDRADVERSVLPASSTAGFRHMEPTFFDPASEFLNK